MKNYWLFLVLTFLLFIIGCKEITKEQQPATSEGEIIEKKSLQLESDRMTPEILWSFGRVSDVQVSPSNDVILFGVTYYDIEKNKGNRELYTIKTDGSDLKRLTYTPENEFNAIWKPDGSKIGYISSKTGSLQIWEINPDGTGKQQISNTEGNITGFKYSPDMKKVLFTSEVPLTNKFEYLYEGLPKSSGRIVNDLMYRHWDHWVDSYSHIFYAEYDGSAISGETDIMKDEPWGSPLSPFGGMEQINWSPDSKTIAYTCKKLVGLDYTLSTNSDIYLYDITTGETTNLTEGMMGFDRAPLYSPDGTKILWESMEREGYESDKNRLFVYDFTTGEKKYHTEKFDQDVHGPVWNEDGRSVFFISDWHGTKEIYQLDVSSNEIFKLTEGVHNYTSVSTAGNELIATRQSMSKPTEIYRVNPDKGEATELSFINKELLDQLTMGNIEKRWIKTTDNKDMLTWIIYPPHFDPGKEYPALLYCQGGPQSMVSQFWSYRWNFQMMAANDYIIVAPNRRGLPGFGQEWNEQISGDYGGQNMKDYFSAIDEMSGETFIDEDRLGAVGASYGGFSVFWIAGNHDGRFKAFIAHDGMFNLEAQYLETEEMWFVNWDLGGAFWEKDNWVAQRSYQNSPHKFVHKWDTPILIIHGELDYRITYTQGMSAFNAAILRGVPARYLHFPDENHWVLTPQNGILWQRNFFDWLDKWLK